MGVVKHRTSKSEFSLGTFDTDSTSSRAHEESVVRMLLIDGSFFLVAFALLLIGLLAALLSHFLLKRDDIKLSRDALATTAGTKRQDLEYKVRSTYNSINSLASFLSVNMPYNNINYYNQYVPFLDKSGLFGNDSSIDELSYFQIVQNKDVNDFLRNVKSWGPEFSNTFIYQGVDEATNKKIPDVTDRQFYLVCIYVYPFNYLPYIVGLNAAANTAAKNQTIMRSISTRAQAATDTVPVIANNVTVRGVIIYSPVYDQNNTLAGIISGVFHSNTIIQATMNSLPSELFVIVKDVTTNDPSAQLIHTTVNKAQANNILGYDPIDYQLNTCNELIKNAPVRHVIQVPCADHTWEVTFIGTWSYVDQYVSSQRWVALSISLIITLIFEIFIVFAFFYRKLIFAREQKKKSEDKINILQVNQKKLRSLLKKLAAQDVRNKVTVDIMPDYLAVISHTGKIVHTNAAFDQVFQFSAEHYHKGLMIGDVLPSLGNQFFITQSINEPIVSIAETLSSKQINVRVIVGVLESEGSGGAEDEDRHTTTTVATPTTPALMSPFVSTQMVDDQAESYVILMVNLDRSNN
ncbi:3 TM domain-containing transmembrane protein [Acrasis kona]|uniref:3 TM domain-containing transmembrane protein n=1 Tax=Acrasis kona TaxID=1008807 RepID=A0AAW2ZJ41_9EUKA